MPLKNRFILSLLAAGSLALGGYSHAAEEVVATVNGAKITTQDMQRFAFEATQGIKGAPRLEPAEILGELLSRELLYQEAMKQGINKRKEVIAEVKQLERKILVGVVLEEAMKANPITDKELQALYDSKVKNQKIKEFKVRHILLKDKASAERIITELDLGGNFSALAKKHSSDDSAKDGGELEWFSAGKMIPEISNTVIQLDKGKYTKAPVQSKFGWHIIKLEDTRDTPPPSFEQIKPQLMQALRQDRVNAYIKSLQDKAKIVINKK